MRFLTLLLISISLFGQAQTPFKVNQSAGSLTGELWLQERRTNGTDWLMLKAPQNLPSSLTFVLPDADGSAGFALVTDGAGQLSFASISGGTGNAVCSSTNGTDDYTCTSVGFGGYVAGACVVLIPDVSNVGAATLDVNSLGVANILRYGGSALQNDDILLNQPQTICYDGTDFILQPSAASVAGAYVNGGNSFGADATIGLTDNFTLTVKTDNAARWSFQQNGMFVPAAHDTYDIGLTGTRVRGVYSGFGEFLKAGGTASSDYMSTRKVNVCDASGGNGCWDVQAGGSMLATSDYKIRDNAGSRWLDGWRAILGTPLNYTAVFSSWVPAKRNTADGDAVTDLVFPNLGDVTAPWAKAYISELYADTLNQSIYPTPTNTYQIGNNSLRLAGIFSVLGNYSGLITASGGMTLTGTFTIPTGAVNGYVLTSNGSGVATWQVASCTTCFHQGGDSFGATAVLGTNDNNTLVFRTNNSNKWSIATGGNITALSDGAYDIGAVSSGRPSNLYITGTYTGANFDGAPSGTTGNYARTRILYLYDNTGSTSSPGAWDLNCVVNGVGAFSESYCYERDNSGNKVWQSERVRSGVAVDRTYWYTDLLPDANLSQKLGSASNLWDTIYVTNLGSDLFPLTDNTYVLGNLTKRWGNVYTVGLAVSSFFTLSSGATNGYCLKSDASGNGTWQTCALSGFTAGRIPYTTSSTTLADTGNLTWDNTSRVVTITGATGTAGLVVTTAYISSGEGFYSAGTATSTVNIPSGGITGKYLIGTTSYTQVGDSAANAGLSGAGQGRIYFDSSTNKFRVSQNGGAYVDLVGAATAAGSNGQVQFNNAGLLGADAAFAWDNTNKYLGIGILPSYKMDISANSSAYLSGPSGTVLHVAGANTTSARVLIDAVGAIPAINTRRAQGTAGSESALLNGNPLLQVGGLGYGSTGYTSSAKVGFTGFATENWSNSAQGTKIVIFTTPNGSTTERVVWDFGQDGSMTPGTNNAFDIGSSSLRVATGYYSTLRAYTASWVQDSATLYVDRLSRTSNQQIQFTVSGSTSTTGSWSVGTVPAAGESTFYVAHNGSARMQIAEGGTVDFFAGANFNGTVTSTIFNATTVYRVSGTSVLGLSGSRRYIRAIDDVATDWIPDLNNTYLLGSSTLRWSTIYGNNVNLSSVLTLGTTITGDLIPTTSNVYTIGSTISYYNMVRSQDMRIHGGSISPSTTGTGTVGGSTARWNRIYVQNIDFTGFALAPDGNFGLSTTKTVRDAAGTGTCTLIFSGGLLTGGTC